MKITLKPNTASSNKNIPYTAHIEIVEATVDFNTVFEVPVYARQVAGQPVYDVEIAGFRVETNGTDYIPGMVEKLLSGLINMARLPSYVFIARHSREIYPVYTVGSEVFVTTPGGPLFRHVELAKVRDYLSDYLHAVGVLGTPGKSDKLHVRGVNGKTLALMRPVFYLKKRITGQTEFWAPVFRSRDGKYLYTYAASVRRQVYEGRNEVLALRDLVAQALMDDNRLENNYDLRPDRLLLESWEQLKTILNSLPTSLTIGQIELPLYQKNDFYIGVELRADEGRYSLFLGESQDDVAARARQDFIRRGMVEEGEPVGGQV